MAMVTEAWSSSRPAPAAAWTASPSLSATAKRASARWSTSGGLITRYHMLEDSWAISEANRP
jgi:hypothetical protein